MNLQDVKDTFLHPAIDLLDKVQQERNKVEHIISTTASVSGSVEVSDANNTSIHRYKSRYKCL